MRENIVLLSEGGNRVTRTKTFTKVVELEGQFLQSMGKLDKRAPGEPDKKDIQVMLKGLYDQESSMSSIVDDMIQYGAAMYTAGIHFKVAQHILGHPAEYANRLTASDALAQTYKDNKSVKGLKTYLTACSTTTTRNDRPQSSNSLLSQLDSSDDEQEVEEERSENEEEVAQQRRRARRAARRADAV